MATIQREAVDPNEVIENGDGRTQRQFAYVWQHGWSYRIFRGVDAEDQAKAHQKKQGGAGLVAKVSRGTNIPPVPFVLQWEETAKAGGTKMDVVRAFDIDSVTDQRELRRYAAKCYKAVNQAADPEDRFPVDETTGLPLVPALPDGEVKKAGSEPVVATRLGKREKAELQAEASA